VDGRWRLRVPHGTHVAAAPAAHGRAPGVHVTAHVVGWAGPGGCYHLTITLVQQ
jgi:hypothetical protein